jgi:hypothetical protein
MQRLTAAEIRDLNAILAVRANLVPELVSAAAAKRGSSPRVNSGLT